MRLCRRSLSSSILVRLTKKGSKNLIPALLESLLTRLGSLRSFKRSHLHFHQLLFLLGALLVLVDFKWHWGYVASILKIGQLLVHDIQTCFIDTVNCLLGSNTAVSVRCFTLDWLLLFDRLFLACFSLALALALSLALALASSLLTTITLHLSLGLGSNPVILLVLS